MATDLDDPALTTRRGRPVLPAYTNAEGAAIHAGLSVQTIWRLVKSRKLPSYRVGGRVLIRYDDLDSMIMGHETRGTHPRPSTLPAPEQEHAGR